MAVNGLMTLGLANTRFELAPALANVSFDFSLCKLSAPEEYRGVGEVLSSKRRIEAEDGNLHKTARRLGALFGELIPPAPKLFKAYGTRASEISSSVTGSQEKSNHGVFASSTGVDATTIWAGATSGSSAIAAHLLACMLARIWDSFEATSIWVEIVKRRKGELARSFRDSDTAYMADIFAANQDITRNDLRRWDACARAWLQVADAVKRTQQTQLRLILDNINYEINNKPDTYTSVIDAWKSSLLQMESLVQGIAQKAQRGDVLLALTSWHLYPDITVVKPSATHVIQKDTLLAPGGVITIGLEKSLSVNNQGVYWSLPLAHLRHYGKPVLSTRSINTAERYRVTLKEFLYTFLGCILQLWGDVGKDTAYETIWLTHMSRRLKEWISEGNARESLLFQGGGAHTWFGLFLSAAENYVSTDNCERELASKLVSLGRRHGHQFLGVEDEPMFGLLENTYWLSLIALDSIERAIRVLRDAAAHLSSEYGIEPGDMFIRYRFNNRVYEKECEPQFAYATAIVDVAATEHLRWVKDDAVEYERLRVNEKIIPSALQGIYESSVKSDSSGNRLILNIRWPKYTQMPSNDSIDGVYVSSIGDHTIAALFVRMSSEAPEIGNKFHYEVGAKHFRQSILDDHISLERLVQFFAKFANRRFYSLPFQMQSHQFRRGKGTSLRGLAAAASIYRHMPNALIDIRVLRQPLAGAYWVKQHHIPLKLGSKYSKSDFFFRRGQAFACLAMFETGLLNIDPERLSNVMAMSAGNSLFVSECLLRDPCSTIPESKICHIEGNIGKPGLAFLVPPPEPLRREPDIGDWRYLDKRVFDGTMRNSFLNTTLHLSFTDANVAIELGSEGGKDVEAYLLETLVSVYDQDEWIADLNVIATMEDVQRFLRIQPCRDQKHDDSDPLEMELTTVDNWYSLLDASENRASLVRAHGNWEARLASASLSVATGHITCILPEKPCWNCLKDVYLFPELVRDCADKQQKGLVVIG